MSQPFLSVLSFSGGTQSTLMLWRILRGEVERPLRFLVLCADPGMEHPETYRHNANMRRECVKAGIDFITATGPSLYYDLLNFKSSGAFRIDNPPYWTKDENGKRGKLRQGCTQIYKIAPMRRALRDYLTRKYSVGAGELREGFVEMWIGFTLDEWHRNSQSDVKYITNRFPIQEWGMDKAATQGWYLKNSIERPPRSVCNACFANGLDYFKDLYENHPEAWQRAVDVDNEVARWKELGLTTHEVFVSASLVRLRDLPAIHFGGDREDMSEYHCNSGQCFI